MRALSQIAEEGKKGTKTNECSPLHIKPGQMLVGNESLMF
jgi:hypothetical protein